MSTPEQQSNKPHRGTGKADKVKPKFEKGKNPRAFISQSGAKASRLARQNVEKEQKKLHVPAIDRTFGGHGAGPSGSKSSTLGGASSSVDPPPVIVAVMGPPGVGKTTLIRSLIRRYTKTTMTDIRGPVTVVTGKNRRLTIIECPNDLGSMIDMGKIADLVLLMIDGSFGLEMETFEALSVMSSHGLPKLIGILTHLDLIKSPATLRAQKQRLKKRFWTEVYDGAKLFYLSGVMNGRYPDRETLNLSRFISVAKFRPLTFRNSHSYLLTDRIEDLTPREEVRQNPRIDRKVAVWGYLRGIPMRAPSASSTLKIHIPGAGVDAFEVSKLAQLADPCPLPTMESEKRRKLNEKHRLVHAPFSGGAAGLLGAGAVSFDGDRVWVNTAGNFTKREGEEGENVFAGEGEKMVMDLQDVDHTFADSIEQKQLRLFASDAAPLSLPQASTSKATRRLAFGEDELQDVEGDGSGDGLDEGSEVDYDDDDDDFDNAGPALRNDSDDEAEQLGDLAHEDDSESSAGLDEDGVGLGFEQAGRKGDIEDLEADNLLGEEDSDSDDPLDISGPQWKTDLSMKARANFLDGQSRRRVNLMSLVYASEQTPEEIAALQVPEDAAIVADEKDNQDEDDLFQLATTTQGLNGGDEEDRFRPVYAPKVLPDWQNDDVVEAFRRFFISGQNFGDDDNANGNTEGFEDLEAGDGDEEEGDEDEDGDGDGDEDGEDDNAEPKPKSKRKTGKLTREEELAAKKERLKRKFDAEYDGSSDEDGKMDFYTEQKEEMRKRLEATQEEFADDDAETRALVEGYRPGSYVRLEFSNVPPELLEQFNPKYPMVVGALLPHEENFGFVQVRIKKHRWHPKILKTNDPLIMSIGWRRFQTVPIYSIDDGSRNRMLKYTPEHMHCLATFYGPISAPNTGLCAFNTITNERPTFRVSATGVVTDIDGSSQITKKLKLTGVPYKIFKNTAYIKDMFTSSLEVAKFEGAHLRTVSGIRGQIKKALPKPEGYFRAAFEDKVLMSDIIFLRAWYQIQPRQYYNPTAGLLMEDKSAWKGMRLTGEVRNAEAIKTPKNVNSLYRPIERQERKFNTLKVPRKLQASLPYASKPKIQKPQSKPTYMQKRAVVLSEEERKAIGLLQQVQAIQKAKVAKRQEKKSESRAARTKKIEKDASKREEKTKEEKREHYRQMGKEKKRKEQSEASGGRFAKKRKQ